MPVRALTPALAEKARNELNEDPNRLESDLLSIKEWIAKQPHLNARTDDQWLVAFLRGSKYSLERTKEKIDLFYSFRFTAPELFRIKYNHALFNKIMDLGVLIILPKPLGIDGVRVCIMRPGKYDTSKYIIMDIMSVANEVMKIAVLEDDHATVAGCITIIDMEGASIGLFLQMTPATMKKSTIFGQEASPFRMKGVHCLNLPSAFETIYSTMKGFLSEKHQNRVCVHKNSESLYELVPKDILPAEYGGNGGTIAEITAYWKNKVSEYSTWLEDDMKYGTDESKRPGKPKTAEDMFGVGSFRRLEFD